MVILSVKFKSTLSYDELLRVANERLPRFQALSGLIQKYYGREFGTGEYTGIYIWDSEDSLREFRESDLAKTIPEVYKVEGQPRFEVFEVPLVLRD